MVANIKEEKKKKAAKKKGRRGETQDNNDSQGFLTNDAQKKTSGTLSPFFG